MLRAVRHIGAFWAETWRVSKPLFFAEMFGTLFGMTAATLMAIGSPTPDLLTVFMCYNISAVLLIYSNYMRHSAWMVVLMCFYLVTTVFGTIRLF